MRDRGMLGQVVRLTFFSNICHMSSSGRERRGRSSSPRARSGPGPRGRGRSREDRI